MATNDLPPLIAAAEDHARRGLWDSEAEHLNRRIIAIEPHNAAAHTRLAKAFNERGDLAEARAIYEHVLEFDPSNRIALNHVGGLARDPAATIPGRLAALEDVLRRALQVTEFLDIAQAPVPAYLWPEGTETFDLGWSAHLRIAGMSRRAWHGLNRKTIHGALRRHSVTWVEGSPPVEGEGTDDYSKSQRLVSLIKHPGGRHVTSLRDLPSVYDDFDVVVHADEVHAPYAYGSLCLTMREDDVARWARHALLRAVAWDAITIAPD
ncbi:MAG: hypothetical protein QOE72_1595 [Chloroflexota bacterium]|jgi:tetratricopeptide (TPR) repeat protein|nr:hypothetical protein [Chloroflexota bacterium]